MTEDGRPQDPLAAIGEHYSPGLEEGRLFRDGACISSTWSPIMSNRQKGTRPGADSLTPPLWATLGISKRRAGAPTSCSCSALSNTWWNGPTASGL
jgi:hypothetical protein